MIRTIFFGSSTHSVQILQKLLTLPEFEVVAVVTKADKPVGRDQLITPNPVADFARQHHLNLLQPSEFTPDFKSELRNLNLDLALCVAYGPPFFDQEMIDIPKFKIVNIHPSPLPKYRGATPGPWQIINGEKSSAVAFFQIDSLPDHGPIIKELSFDITPSETAITFYDKAFKIAVDNLESVLSTYISNPESIIPQDHSQKTYFPKFTKDTAKIDWTWSSDKVYRFINALIPWPVAWTEVKNQKDEVFKMKIFSATPDLKLNEVQIEGKNKTTWPEIEKYYQILKD